VDGSSAGTEAPFQRAPQLARLGGARVFAGHAGKWAEWPDDSRSGIA